jgi:hypothetical protein
MKDTNSIEERAVEMMLTRSEGSHTGYLRDQMRSACVVKRTFTGCGFFSDLSVPDTCAPIPGEPRFQLSGVSGISPKLQHGIGFVLFVERGRLSMLEAFTYDEPWPTDPGEIALAYVREGDRPESTAGAR